VTLLGGMRAGVNGGRQIDYKASPRPIEPLFVEQTCSHRRRRHRSVGTERGTTAKPSSLIQTLRRTLPASGFQAQCHKPCGHHLGLDSPQHSLSHAKPSCTVAHIHALDLSKISEHCHAAAPDRFAIQSGDEEADVRLEDCFQRKQALGPVRGSAHALHRWLQ
jgi:hypothetical protein